MNISNSTLDQLFKTLGEYNPTTNSTMEKIALVLQPLALAIVGILFMVELTNYSKKFDREDGGMTTEALLNVALKYVIAAAMIMGSGYIIDGIVWFGVQMIKWINSIITLTGTSDAIPAIGKAPFWAKPLLFLFQIFAYIGLWLSEFVATILIFLRAVQLYIVKAIAPILIAFFVSEELRSIAIGFLKQVMAFVLQGALLVLIIGLIPVLTANDYLSFASFEGGVWASAGTVVINTMIYVSLILKYIAVIIILVGSQGMAKRFIGAM